MGDEFSGPAPEGWEAVISTDLWARLAQLARWVDAEVDTEKGLIWRSLWIWEDRKSPPVDH